MNDILPRELQYLSGYLDSMSARALTEKDRQVLLRSSQIFYKFGFGEERNSKDDAQGDESGLPDLDDA